jgi:Response regulator receiver domain
MGGNEAHADAMKVLVVEDDPFVREMAVTGLENAGFVVTEAASGGEALNFLHAGIAVDALLTDIRLPGADGWTVASPLPYSFLRHPVSGRDPQKGDDDDRDDEGCGRSGPWWAHVAPAQT